MRRRIIWSQGDSQPIAGHVVVPVDGSGIYVVKLAFAPSSVDVAFSKEYDSRLPDGYGGHYESDPYDFSPQIYIDSLMSSGFNVNYQNVPTQLEFNYFAM